MLDSHCALCHTIVSSIVPHAPFPSGGGDAKDSGRRRDSSGLGVRSGAGGGSGDGGSSSEGSREGSAAAQQLPEVLFADADELRVLLEAWSLQPYCSPSRRGEIVASLPAVWEELRRSAALMCETRSSPKSKRKFRRREGGR